MKISIFGIVAALLMTGCATVPYETPRGVVWGYVVREDDRPGGFDLLGYWPEKNTCQSRVTGGTSCRPLVVGNGSERFWAYNFYGVKPGSFGASNPKACEWLREQTTAQTSPCIPITVRFLAP